MINNVLHEDSGFTKQEINSSTNSNIFTDDSNVNLEKLKEMIKERGDLPEEMKEMLCNVIAKDLTVDEVAELLQKTNSQTKDGFDWNVCREIINKLNNDFYLGISEKNDTESAQQYKEFVDKVVKSAAEKLTSPETLAALGVKALIFVNPKVALVAAATIYAYKKAKECWEASKKTDNNESIPSDLSVAAAA